MNRRELLKSGGAWTVAAAVAASIKPARALLQPGGSVVSSSGQNRNGLGVNLNGIQYYNGQLPFLNIFLPGQWITAVNGGTFDTGEEAYLPLDANGWPTAVTAAGKTFNMARKLVNYAIKTASYTGTPYPAHSASADGSSYTIQGQGAGTINLGGDVDHNSLSSTSPGIAIGGTNGTVITSTATAGQTWSVTFGITTPSAGIDFQLQATTAGNTIQNIQIFETRYAANVAAGDYFNPVWQALISQFQCIRCMDWLQTNNSTPSATVTGTLSLGATGATLSSAWTKAPGSYRFFFDNGDSRVATCSPGSQTIDWTASGGLSKATTTTTVYYSTASSVAGWSSRIPTSYATYSTVPWEICVALANAANTDLWINIPAGMQMADFQSLMSYIYANLKPGLRCYVEWSNEVWNGAFNGSSFSQWQGQNLWPDYATRGYSAFDCQLNYAGYQLSQMVDTAKTVFGASYGTRVVIVAGGQAANTYIANTKLTAPLAVAEGTITQAPYKEGLMHVCIAPYFGNYNVPPQWLVQSQSTSLTSLFAEINTGGQIAGDGGTSYLTAAYSQITNHVNLLAAAPYAGLGMMVLGYESGQTLISNQNDTNVISWSSTWASNHAYSVGQVVIDSNGYAQRCTTAGTSGSSHPTWNDVVGGATTDNTVTWTRQISSWAANTSYSSGNVVIDSAGHAQQCTTGGTSGASAPTWNATVGNTTADNTVTWTRINNRAPRWCPGCVFAVGDPIKDSNGYVQVCTTAGTSGSTEPTWSTADQGTTSDNGTVWTLEKGPSPPADEYTSLFATANKDSRMGTAYTNYYTQWKALGGALCNTFVDISQYNKFGQWGAAEDLEQLAGQPLASTPYKWQAIVNFSQGNPRWWN